MTRWHKGTNDQDGDGHKGGSLKADHSDKGPSAAPSRSDQAPDPEKGDTTMAKAPTKPAAGGQPWAKPADAAATDKPATTGDNGEGEAAGGNGGGVGDVIANGAAAPVVTSTEQIPSSDGAELGTDNEDDNDVLGTHELADAIAENDTAKTAPGSELPSFVRDQISPSGIDVALEADRSDKPSLERSAYPSVGEKINALLEGASDEVREQFEEAMVGAAEKLLADLQASKQDDLMSERLIDGTTHYGPRVRPQAAVDGAPLGASSAERNRRARRAAERVQREAAAKRG